MQDPYYAVKEEVEHSVTVVIDLHKRWQELSTNGKRGDEFEWTSGELLSGLRSIEWDLQDLEDTVSIVEGNREKFQLEESELQERKGFIETTRRQIVGLRDEVQGHAMSNDSPGFSTGKGKPSLPAIGGKKKGYGKVESQDDSIELMPAAEDVDSPNPPSSRLTTSDPTDEILGGEAETTTIMSGNDSADAVSGRHRKKKACLLCTLVLALLLIIIAAISSGAVPVPSKLKNATSTLVREGKGSLASLEAHIPGVGGGGGGGDAAAAAASASPATPSARSRRLAPAVGLRPLERLADELSRLKVE
jgi:hypothetical protein